MELSAATLLFLSLISVVILVSLLNRKTTPSSKKRRPPGPWGLPLVGSLHHLVTSQPQVALRDLAKKHGPVMYLRLGQVDTVVVSSPTAAQEVLRDKDISFASRPSLLASEIFCHGNIDVAFAPYGAYWPALRKFCMLGLLSARKVRRFAPVRDSETISLVMGIRAAGCGGEPVNVDGMEQFLSSIGVALKEASGFCVRDLFPSLWFLDVVTGTKRRIRRAHRQTDAVFDKIIADCDARREEKKTKPAATTTGDEDLLSVMLRIRDEGELEFPIGITNIKAVIVDMFTAGTETTSSIVEWLMSELMRNPEVMAKAQAEVRETLDGKSPQDHEGHMDMLCYTRMVIKESMRLHPAVPLLLPRICRKTCDVCGFEITEGPRVMVNAWEMARSSEHWQDAEEFRPERFEDSLADYKGTQLEYLPFGRGRRMCPGNGFSVIPWPV